MNHKMKRVFDPLYGVTYLSDLEYELVMSPEIQRLRYVRLCNINSLLISGASEISRFEHVLGVLRLAKEWVKSQHDLDINSEVEFISAALLHDFQTGPFGHSLQYVFEDNESGEDFKHDDLAHGTYLKHHQVTDANATFCGKPFLSPRILSSKWDNVVALIKGEGKNGPLISGSMDLDNIDNVIRLAFHVGVANSKDAEVALDLARNLKVVNSELYCPESSISSIKRWFDIRQRLYELLLLDWAEFSAKAMLTKSMELAVEFDLLGPDTWLKTDLELYNMLEKDSVGDAQEIGNLIRRIKCGDLYFPVALVRSKKVSLYKHFSSIESKRELERSLSIKIKRCIDFPSEIIIHPILDVKKTQRSVTIIEEKTKKSITIGEDSKQLLIGIFIPNEITSDVKLKKVNELIKDFLIEQGLPDISDIEDPLTDKKEVQLDLL